MTGGTGSGSESKGEVRPLPLKIAGAIGAFSAMLYLAVAVGQSESLGAALFWFVIMATASLLAWFADQFPGRRAAIGAAVLFFVVGILSPLILAIAFLVAVSLCVIGFVDLSRE